MVPTLHQNLYSLFEKTGIFPIIADHYQTITWYFKMDVYLIICKNRSQANLSTRRQYYMDSKGTSWVLCCISLLFPNYACEDFFCPFFCQYLDSSDNTLLMIVIGFFFINCIKKKHHSLRLFTFSNGVNVWCMCRCSLWLHPLKCRNAEANEWRVYEFTLATYFSRENWT